MVTSDLDCDVGLLGFIVCFYFGFLLVGLLYAVDLGLVGDLLL